MLPENWLEILKAEYPRREGDNGWLNVRTVLPRHLHGGTTWERVLKGTKAYRAHCDKTGKTGTELVKQAKTFYGPSAFFEEWAEMPIAMSEAERKEAIALQKLTDRRAAIGLADFREPQPGETADQYRQAQDAEWARRRPLHAVK